LVAILEHSVSPTGSWSLNARHPRWVSDGLHHSTQLYQTRGGAPGIGVGVGGQRVGKILSLGFELGLVVYRIYRSDGPWRGCGCCKFGELDIWDFQTAARPGCRWTSAGHLPSEIRSGDYAGTVLAARPRDPLSS
jgi:hypothetical protein